MAATVQQKDTLQPEAPNAPSEQAQAQSHSPAPQQATENLRALEQPTPQSELNARIEQHIAQRRHEQQDQQELYSSVWAGLAAAIIKTQPANPPSDFRRRVEQLVQELTLAEERERKRKRGGRDETFFRALVSLVGEKEAETIQQKIETLQKTPGANTQDAAQLAKDIASKLASNDTILSLHTGTQSVERSGAASGQSPLPAESLDIRHPFNHPVPEIRDALIQMAQPNVNPAGGHVTLPEMEPIARQLFPAAQNLGFTGTRDQFTETLYVLSHSVENGQGMRADQILHLTEQSLSQNGQIPNAHLVSIMTDALARIQYAKAASINAGEATHFILRDGEQPAQVRGQILSDEAAQILQGTGGFGPLGSHGFGPAAPGSTDSSAAVAVRNLNGSAEGVAAPQLKKIVPGAKTPENLDHNPEIALPLNSEAPKFKVSSVAELTKQLKELGTKAAHALARGDAAAARAIETEASDTLHDNKALIAERSPQEQEVLKSLAIQAKVAELKRLEEVKTGAEKAISALQTELAKDLASKAVSGKADPEGAKKIFAERSDALLARLDPAAAGLVSASTRQEATEAFLKTLSQKTAEVAEADKKVLEQEKAAVRAKLAEALTSTLEKVKTPGPELAAALEKSAGAATAELEKKLQDPELQALFARSPEALSSLRDLIASEKKRVTDSAASAADFLKRAEKDLENALQFNPVVGAAILEGPQGAELLQAHLGRLKDGKARAGFLSSLKTGMGSEKLAAIVDAYDKTTGRPLALDIVQMSQGPEARKAAFKSLTDSSATLLTPAQNERLTAAVQRDVALTRAVIREELKAIEATLDANAQKAVVARDHLGELLGKKEDFAKLPNDTMEGAILAEVRSSYKLDPNLPLEDTLTALRSRSGKIEVDPKTGKERHSPVTKEEEKAVQVLARLRELQGLREHNETLREMQKKGVDGELERHLAAARSVYGTAVVDAPPIMQAHLDAQAAQYVKGIRERISRAPEGESRDALIAERDALEWRVASTRVALSLDPSRADVAQARQTVEKFLLIDGPQRSKPFKDAAEGVLGTFKDIEAYRAKALALVGQTRESQAIDPKANLDRLTEKGKALDPEQLRTFLLQSGETQAPQKEEARSPNLSRLGTSTVQCHTNQQDASRGISLAESEKFLGPSSSRRVVLEGQLREGLDKNTKHWLGRIGGAAPLPESELMTAEKQLGLNLGGTKERYADLHEDWLAVEGRSQLAYEQLNSLALAPTSPLLEARPSSAAERKVAAKAEALHDALNVTSDAPLKSDALRKLRELAKDDPQLGAAFASVPASLNASDPKEESRLVLARLSPSDQQRVRLVASLQERSSKPAHELWAAAKKLNDEDGSLSVELDAAVAATKLHRVQRSLDFLSPEERRDVEARFAQIHGQTVGAALIAARPFGERGVQMLAILSAADVVASDDLKPFFPQGASIPEGQKERTEQLLQLLEKDRSVQFMTDEERSKLEEENRKQSEARGQWLAVRQAAGRTGDRKSFERAQTELDKLDKILAPGREEIFKRHSPDYIARSGHRELMHAVQEHADHSVASAAQAPDSRYSFTTRRVVEALRDATPDYVRATELLRRGSFSEAETTLVRVLYAEQAAQKPLSENQRRLSGDLARDLSSSRDPNNLETKRAELLARGGQGSLTDADIMLVRDAIRRGDQRDTLRGLVALKAVGALEAAGEMLECLPPETKGYVDAVRSNDTVRQLGYETTSALQTGVVKASEALGKVQELGEAGAQKLASIPGLSKAMGEYAPAWDKIVTPGMYEEGVKLAASTGLKLNDTDAIVSAFSLMPPGQGGELAKYLDGAVPDEYKGKGWVECIRARDGWKGMYDAALLEQLLTLSANGQALSPEQLANIRSIRQAVGDQMSVITELYSSRNEIREKSYQVWKDVIAARNKAEEDKSNAPILQHACTSYGLRVDNHQSFLQKQNQLWLSQDRGLNDILQTKRTMAVMSVVMLKDVAAKRANGIGLSHIETEHTDLRQRDLKRDCWVVVRPEYFEEWRKKDQELRDSIERWEIGAEVTHCVAKVAVIGVVSLCATPATGLLVATAWNAADKTYRYAVNGESLGSVLAWGGLELALDVASFGLAKGLTALRASQLEIRAGEKVFTATAKRAKDVIGKGAVHASESGGVVTRLTEAGLEKAAVESIETEFIEIAKKGGQWMDLVIKEVPKRSTFLSPHIPNLSSTSSEPPKIEIPKADLSKPDLRLGAVPGVSLGAVPLPPVMPALPTELPSAAPPLTPANTDVAKQPTSPTISPPAPVAAPGDIVVSPSAIPIPPTNSDSVQPVVKDQVVVNMPRADLQGPLIEVAPVPLPAVAPSINQLVNGFYGTFGGLFQHNILGFLNTGGIFTFNNDPVTVAPNIPPPQPPPAPPTSAEEKPTPPSPPSYGPTLSPIAGETVNTYVLAAMREQKLAEANAVPRAEQVAEAAKNQVSVPNYAAIANQQQAAQQQAVAARLAQEQEQALVQYEAIAKQQAVAKQEAIARQQATAEQQATAQQQNTAQQQTAAQQQVTAQQQNTAQQQATAQQQFSAFADMRSEQAMLQGASAVEASKTASAAPFATAQWFAAAQTSPEAEHLVRAALVENPQGKRSDAASAVRMAEAPEQAAERAASDAQKLANAERSSTARQERQRSAEREASQSLEQEAQKLVAQKSPVSASNSVARSEPERVEARAATEAQRGTVAASVTAGQSTEPLNGSKAFATQITSLEKLEAVAQAIEASEQEDEQLGPEHRKARKAKALLAKARLREILMHQLQSMLFEQGKKERMLRLLIALGISEKEYRELVATIGEMEAKARAERQESRKQAIAVEREAPRLKVDSSKIAVTPSLGKSPLRMKEPESAPQLAPKAQAPQPNRVSRAELYVRMKE